MSARMMKSEPAPWYVKWGITFVVGLIIVLAMALSRDIFDQVSAAKVWRILCDGCFLAAVLLVCVGLMTFVSSEGMFDILSYGMICFVGLFKKKEPKQVKAPTLPGGEEEKKNSNFFDYKQSKAGTRSAQWYLVFVGLIYLAAAFLCMFMYNVAGKVPLA